MKTNNRRFWPHKHVGVCMGLVVVKIAARDARNAEVYPLPDGWPKGRRVRRHQYWWFLADETGRQGGSAPSPVLLRILAVRSKWKGTVHNLLAHLQGAGPSISASSLGKYPMANLANLANLGPGQYCTSIVIRT